MENISEKMNQEPPRHAKSHALLIKSVFLLLVAFALFLAIWLVTTHIFPRQSSGFQAVTLSNGRVVYGHLETNLSKDFVRLTNVYYLLTEQSETEEGAQQEDFALIKPGKEIHGPEDDMLLNREHIIYIEDLREDSEVVKAITAYEAN